MVAERPRELTDRERMGGLQRRLSAMRTRLGLGGQVAPGRRGEKEQASKRPACQTTCQDVTDLLQSWPGSGTPAKRPRTHSPVVTSPGFKIYEDYSEI